MIVLDFFSGSGTTAHAVMQLNAEDGGNRKFIMVQLPEETDEKSEAYKAGYKNICEIGKERIRRAGDKIKEESQDKTQIKEAINALCKEKQQILPQQDEHWIEMYCAGELTLDALKIQLQGTNNIISEIEEFIKNGIDGYLIPTGNIEQLAQKIEYLIENETERLTMGKNARRNAIRYSENEIIDSWNELFLNL